MLATIHHQRRQWWQRPLSSWYNALAKLMKDFPTDAAIEALRGHGVEYGRSRSVLRTRRLRTRDRGTRARSDVTMVSASKWNNKDVTLCVLVERTVIRDW
jgi:hypothetical protein